MSESHHLKRPSRHARLALVAFTLTAFAVGPTVGRATSVSARASENAQVTLSVTVDGPTHVENEGYYTYEAFPTGGGGNYTYEWEVKIQGLFTPLGTGKTQSYYIAEGTGEIFMYVTVTSASGTKREFKYTTNGIGCDTDICLVER